MAVTSKFYPLFFKSAFNKELDLDSDTIKLMLLKTGYAFSTAHQYLSSVVSYEVSGSGYTAGGATCALTAPTFSSGVLSFDGADVSWGTVTLTGGNIPYFGVLYDSTPSTDATRPLIGIVDFGGGDYAPNGGPLQVTWNASGIGAVTVA